MFPAFLAAAMACMPKYANLDPIGPEQLWTPHAVEMVMVDGIEVATIDTGARAGSDEPPLLLIHGLSSYMGFWEYQIPHFAQSRRVIALDLPGYGSSSRPDAPCTPPWYADVVASVLDAKGIASADVMGHSMGGQVALTLALDHPSRVNRLVLSAPAGFERFDAGASAFMKEWWTEDRALRTSEQELRMVFTTAVFNKPDAGVERLLEERVRMSNTESFRGTSVAVARSVHGMLDHPVADRLPEIDQPTLIVFGTEDRMIPNPAFTGGRTRAIAESGQRAMPSAQLVMLPGAGHTVHHDDAAGFNTAVDQFLAPINWSSN